MNPDLSFHLLDRGPWGGDAPSPIPPLTGTGRGILRRLKAAMAKMRAMQVARAGGSLEIVERDVPEPVRGEVRVRVEVCGVCHSDSFTVEGQWPNLSFPRIPGHEIAGVIDAIGAGVVGSASASGGLAGIVGIASRAGVVG